MRRGWYREGGRMGAEGEDAGLHSYTNSCNATVFWLTPELSPALDGGWF